MRIALEKRRCEGNEPLCLADEWRLRESLSLDPKLAALRELATETSKTGARAAHDLVTVLVESDRLEEAMAEAQGLLATLPIGYYRNRMQDRIPQLAKLAGRPEAEVRSFLRKALDQAPSVARLVALLKETGDPEEQLEILRFVANLSATPGAVPVRWLARVALGDHQGADEIAAANLLSPEEPSGLRFAPIFPGPLLIAAGEDPPEGSSAASLRKIPGPVLLDGTHDLPEIRCDHCRVFYEARFGDEAPGLHLDLQETGSEDPEGHEIILKLLGRSQPTTEDRRLHLARARTQFDDGLRGLALQKSQQDYQRTAVYVCAWGEAAHLVEGADGARKQVQALLRQVRKPYGLRKAVAERWEKSPVLRSSR